MRFRSRAKKFLALFFVLVFVATAAACGGDDDDESGNRGTAAPGGEVAEQEGNELAPMPDRPEGTEGGEVTIGGEQEPTGINWLAAADNAAWTQYFMQHLWQGAIAVEPDGTIVRNPDIATRVELVNEDPLTVEYEINETAKWNDGQPVSADDFAFTWEAQRGDLSDETDPETGDPIPVYQAAGTNGYELMESVEGEGNVVTVTYKEPYADWRAVFDYLLHRPAFEAVGGGDAAKGFNEGFKIETIKADQVPTNGPFKVTSITPTDSIVLERNENFGGERTAYLDKVTIKWITDATQQPQALQNKEVQVIYPQAQLDLVDQTRDIDGIETFVGFGTFWEHLDLNGRNTHLADQKVRQAVAKAIDRNSVVEALVKPFSDDGEVLDNRIFFPGGKYYEAHGEGYEQGDPDAAKALLEEAGYTDNGGTFEKDGEKLTIGIAWRDPNPRREDTAKLVQAQLAAAGIEATLDPKPDFEFLDSGDFDIALFGWTGGTTLGSNKSIYASDGGQNFTKLGTDEIDEMLNDTDVELDIEARAKLWNEIDVALWEQMATIPMFQVPEFLAWSSEVNNVTYNGYQGFAWDMEDWSL